MTKAYEFLSSKFNTTDDEGRGLLPMLGFDIASDSNKDFESRISMLCKKFSLVTLENFKAARTVFIEFDALAARQTNAAFLNKLSVINAFLKVHGYGSILEVTSNELFKLKPLYQTFGKSLSALTLQDAVNLDKFGLKVLGNLKALSQPQVQLLNDFLKKVGIKLTLSADKLAKAPLLQKLLDALKYEDWLKADETDKITSLFNELGIGTIDKWTDETAQSLQIIVDSFGINLPEMNSLEIEEKLLQVKALKISVTSLAIAESQIAAIRHFEFDSANLDQLQVDSLQKLFNLLEGDKRPNMVGFLNWLSNTMPISIDLKEDQVKAIKTKLTSATGKAFKDITVAHCEQIDTLLSALNLPNIADITAAQLQKAFQAFPFSDIENIQLSSEFGSVLRAFELNFETDAALYKSIRSFFKFFDIEILSLTWFDSRWLMSIVGCFNKSAKKLDEPFKNVLFEVKNLLTDKGLFNIEKPDVEKVLSLARGIGVVDPANLTVDNVKRIKIIADTFAFKIQETDSIAIEALVNLLQQVNFNGTSWWYSEESVFKQKLEPLATMVKKFQTNDSNNLHIFRYIALFKAESDWKKDLAFDVQKTCHVSFEYPITDVLQKRITSFVTKYDECLAGADAVCKSSNEFTLTGVAATTICKDE